MLQTSKTLTILIFYNVIKVTNLLGDNKNGFESPVTGITRLLPAIWVTSTIHPLS